MPCVAHSKILRRLRGSEVVKKSHRDTCHSEPPKRSEGRSRNPLQYARFARSAGDPSLRLGMTLRRLRTRRSFAALRMTGLSHLFTGSERERRTGVGGRVAR